MSNAILSKVDQRNIVIDSAHFVPTISGAELSSLLESAAEGIIVFDGHARMLIFNRACERLFGYSRDEMLGRRLGMIMPSEFPGMPADDTSLATRETVVVGREAWARHRNGTMFPIEFLVGETDVSHPKHLLGIVRDLRPGKEVHERLRRLRGDLLRLTRVSAMDQMGAVLAHEINQPLTALMLYLQAASRTCEQQNSSLSRQLSFILHKAVHEAERAGDVIHRMRRFIGRHDPKRYLVDINPLVDDAVELTLLGIPRGTRISRRLEDGLPQVFIDPVQIQEAVVSLMRNAIEAIKDRTAPEVIVATRRSDEGIEITIEDNGRGIAANTLPTLFKAFTSSKEGGLGLGLAISRSIAQNHGGDLKVDPGGAGRGARFTLHLPLPAPASE